jgi:hypothetical protein
MQRYSFSITLATSPPQRVQTPRNTNIPFSILPVKLPIPVVFLHWKHQTLLRILNRMSPGIDSQIFLALGVNVVSSIIRLIVVEN